VYFYYNDYILFSRKLGLVYQIVIIDMF